MSDVIIMVGVYTLSLSLLVLVYTFWVFYYHPRSVPYCRFRWLYLVAPLNNRRCNNNIPSYLPPHTHFIYLFLLFFSPGQDFEVFSPIVI